MTVLPAAVPFFRQLRLAEIGDTIVLLKRFAKPTRKLLEIGAGTGWQARALNDAGFTVEAIDLPPSSHISNHARVREWPIRDYDGVHIPFPDETFDIVYSSNVLEHVEALEMLMGEMRRVLRPDGIALHLLPNPQWRILSLLTYYPGQAVDALRAIRKRLAAVEGYGEGKPTVVGKKAASSLLAKVAIRLLPRPHGSRGSALGEISRYSRGQWNHFFKCNGWDIVYYANNGLTASGDYLFGGALPISARRVIGRATGGIAHIYVLSPVQCRIA